jgi:type IV secretory pathway VirB9-like protein
MKKLILSVITLLISINAFAWTEPRTLICDFDGENASKVYSLVTMPGIGTTFRLPDAVKITDFVVTDSRNFHAESNGTIGIVTPITLDKSTSVSIYTDNDKLYVFFLTSKEASVLDQLVVVQSSDMQLFNQRVRADAQMIAEEQNAELSARFEANLEQQTAQLKRHMLFSINSDYRVTGNIFAIDRVSDDGVFTYVRIARSQERPVVYIGEAGKLKELEIVKYTDEGDHYVIHRVLQPSDKGFVLKLGDKTTEIKRR